MRYGLSESNGGLFGDRTCFPAQSSVLDEEALLQRVVPEYDISAAKDCLFFSRGDPDIYQVHTVGPTFYLKVYRPPHPAAQAEAEAHLVADLSRHGASVVAAVRRRGGAFATEVVASEGRRPVLLFEEAPADGLDPLEEDSCRQLGVAVAKLHSAGGRGWRRSVGDSRRAPADPLDRRRHGQLPVANGHGDLQPRMGP